MHAHTKPEERQAKSPAKHEAPLTQEQIQICITRKEEILNGTVKGIDRTELHKLARYTQKL